MVARAVCQCQPRESWDVGPSNDEQARCTSMYLTNDDDDDDDDDDGDED